MSELGPIPDAQIRGLAETTFDRNVVVIAGAGTGKTTLLVNRLVHALMREPDPVEITHIVALTFTNKAATEMKVRLRERLLGLLAADDEPRAFTDSGMVDVAVLRKRYGLSSERIVARAEAALRDLEKAQIGTLHSFAAHLLRLYPIESGVDPGFKEDDGLRFEEHFAVEWELWLAGELGPDGPDHRRWRRLLTGLGLDRIREMSLSLCSELVPLEELRSHIAAEALSPALRRWIMGTRARAAELLAGHERAKRRKAESLLAAAVQLFDLLLRDGPSGPGGLEAADRDRLGRDLGGAPVGWTLDDFTEAEGLIRIAKKILTVDPNVLRDLLAMLTPFVRRVRASFLEEGWISFDGLLARAQALLREHPSIRERVKQEYHAVLVDEFQDTDPIQYEIMLYLAERPGRCSPGWREVELAPGKLFIVGDPKQSIYAFRRADIEAFDQVVEKIRSSGGMVHELVTNFRSHAEVLRVVNGLFDRLLRPTENVQPPNVPLEVRPNRRESASLPGVDLRLVKASGEAEEFDAAAATRVEAETLARWIKEDLLPRETLTDAVGRIIPMRPGHLALLFRKLTQAQDYLDALRRHDVPYITDGEKHFYRRQEVVDLVNLLRLVDNPHDSIALVGTLRSPLGGVTDRELYELHERGALDYRRADRVNGWKSPRAPAVQRLYERLVELSWAAPRYPLPEAVELVFTYLPVLELAAGSLHGEQAVANLTKVRQMAADLADRPHLTWTGFVDLMMSRLSEQPEEAESALAEESLEAVRVLTIHKAKGLEFPVVILPGLHHGASPGTRHPPVSQDWSSGVLGMTAGDRCSLGAVLICEKYLAREEAERRRVFYVGMTRAKERVILSGGLAGRSARGTFLSLFTEAAGDGVGEPERPVVHVGPVPVRQTVVTAAEGIPSRRTVSPTVGRPPGDWDTFLARWEERQRAWTAACETRSHLTPTLLMMPEGERTRKAGREGADAARSRLIGTLAHRVLAGWDFADDPRRMEERVEIVCRNGIPEEWAHEREGITLEVQAMLGTFVTSEPYEALRRATILGRELPFSIPWPSPTPHPSPLTPHLCVMHGFIDVVYRLEGQVWIGDYKTDHVREDEMEQRADAYRVQALVYAEAVSRCLGLEKVGCKLVFLRNGRAVQV